MNCINAEDYFVQKQAKSLNTFRPHWVQTEHAPHSRKGILVSWWGWRFILVLRKGGNPFPHSRVHRGHSDMVCHSTTPRHPAHLPLPLGLHGSEPTRVP